MAQRKKRRPSSNRPAGGDQAARQARREERRRREEEARQRAARRRRLRNWGIIAFVVLAAILLIFVSTRPKPEVAGVERTPDKGRRHLAASETYDYRDPAPTSGPHSEGASTSCGVLDSQPPLVESVHALEHGVVVIWYQPGETAIRDALADLVEKYDSHVLVAPNPGIEKPVVATAWNRRMSFDKVDSKLREFVDTYRKRGPEQVDCPI